MGQNSSADWEVIDLAKLAKSTRWQGPTNIDPLIARQTIEQVADIVSDIVNSSFETGIVPLALKSAKITHIYKQRDKLEVTNYRPILPYFAKITEKAMSNRLTDYIEKISVLYPLQFGFRTGHSTDMALINMH